jgi:hypothetical protein
MTVPGYGSPFSAPRLVDMPFRPRLFPEASASLRPQTPELLSSSRPQTPELLPAATAAAGLSPGSDAITGVMPGVLDGLSPFQQYVLPGAGAAIGAYSLYDLLRDTHSPVSGGIRGGLAGAGTGASIGTMIEPGLGTAIGGGIGALFGGGLGAFSGKGQPHPETADRRSALQQIDSLLQGLRTGSARDSSFYNVANNTPDTASGQLVGAVNPLSELLVSQQQGDFNTPDTDKRRSDLTGMLVNTALRSGGDPFSTVKQLYDRAGLDHNQAYQGILALRKSGQIEDDAQRDAYLAAIDKLYGISNPNAEAAAPSKPQQSGFTWTLPRGPEPKPTGPLIPR